MKMFIYVNPNPAKKNTGDCVIRAICVLERKHWLTVLHELTDYSDFCTKSLIATIYGPSI